MAEEYQIDSNLPDEYQPISLRPKLGRRRRKTGYGLGFRSGNGIEKAVGCLTLQGWLDYVPSGDDLNRGMPIIIRLNRDGSEEVLYVWHIHHQKWVRERENR